MSCISGVFYVVRGVMGFVVRGIEKNCLLLDGREREECGYGRGGEKVRYRYREREKASVQRCRDILEMFIR